MKLCTFQNWDRKWTNNLSKSQNHGMSEMRKDLRVAQAQALLQQDSQYRVPRATSRHFGRSPRRRPHSLCQPVPVLSHLNNKNSVSWRPEKTQVFPHHHNAAATWRRGSVCPHSGEMVALCLRCSITRYDCVFADSNVKIFPREAKWMGVFTYWAL